jgi:hypothetical protein
MRLLNYRRRNSLARDSPRSGDAGRSGIAERVSRSCSRRFFITDRKKGNAVEKLSVRREIGEAMLLMREAAIPVGDDLRHLRDERLFKTGERRFDENTLPLVAQGVPVVFREPTLFRFIGQHETVAVISLAEQPYFASMSASVDWG